MDGLAAARIDRAIDDLRTYADETQPQRADEMDRAYLSGLWYNDLQPGNTAVMNKMEFSFRTDSQYKVPNFVLFEDRWQQMARMTGGAPAYWTEKAVNSAVAGETYPFPGKAKLAEEPSFATQDLQIAHAVGNGLRDTRRNSGTGDLATVYKTPSLQDVQKKNINGNYPIIGSTK